MEGVAMKRLQPWLWRVVAVMVGVGGVLLVTPMRREAGGAPKPVTHEDLARLIRVVRHDVKKIEDLIRTVAVPPEAANHTLRWDKVLDSTNGNEEGCNSDRFKCIMPTDNDPAGEAVLDMETGLVW